MRGAIRWILYAALAALYVLHNDLWLWSDTRLVLGLPVGLLYHIVYCLVTSVVLAMLVKWAWPVFDPGDAAPTAPDSGAGFDSAGAGARHSSDSAGEVEGRPPAPGEPAR